MTIKVTAETMKRYWQKENNCLAFELSDLECMNIYITPSERPIVVENTTSNNARRFEFTHKDMDSSHEDTYGWNYKSRDGIELLIIND